MTLLRFSFSLYRDTHEFPFPQADCRGLGCARLSQGWQVACGILRPKLKDASTRMQPIVQAMIAPTAWPSAPAPVSVPTKSGALGAGGMREVYGATKHAPRPHRRDQSFAFPSFFL